MLKSSTLNVRVEPDVKVKTQRIFKRLGLSTSEAIYLFLKRVVAEKGLPFELKLPNRTTRKVLKDSEVGKNIVKHDSIDALLKDLND